MSNYADLNPVEESKFVNEHLKIIFSIGMVFSKRDQRRFDLILDYFNRHAPSYIGLPYETLTYENPIVQTIETLYEIGNGNYHLLMVLVNPLNNKPCDQPLTSIDEIEELIIEFHQTWGVRNPNIKAVGNNFTRTDSMTHRYTGPEFDEPKNPYYQSLDMNRDGRQRQTHYFDLYSDLQTFRETEIEEIEEKKRVKNKSVTSKGGRTNQEKKTLYYQMKQTELLPDRVVRSRLDEGSGNSGNYGYFMKQNARDEIQDPDGIYFNLWDDFNN